MSSFTRLALCCPVDSRGRSDSRATVLSLFGALLILGGVAIAISGMRHVRSIANTLPGAAAGLLLGVTSAAMVVIGAYLIVKGLTSA